MTPPKLAGNGKDFEKLLLARADHEEKRGLMAMSRYGVQATMIKGKWTPVASLPDFEGAITHGRQFIIEAKVCSGPSFPLTKDKIKPRQVSHMLSRASLGVPCFVLIHFNERLMIKSRDAAFTVAIPVSDDLPFWRVFVDAHAVARRTKEPVEPQGSISRERAREIGMPVQWNAAKGCRTVTPDLLALLAPETVEPQLF